MNTRLNVLIAGLLSVFLVGCAPAANAARTTVVSPLPTPSGGIQLESITDIALTAADGTQLPNSLFFRVTLAGNKLFGAERLPSGKVGLYMIDLDSGRTQQLGSLSDGISSVRASDRCVVWNRGESDVLLYDLQTNKETLIATGARYQDISGDNIVWTDWRTANQPNSLNIYGYSLANEKEFPIIMRPGAQAYPRLSDQWMIYLDSIEKYTADIFAYNLNTHEDFKIGVMPMLGDRIGTVDWYPVISGKNIVWVSEDNQLHQYDLNSRTDRVLPVSVSLEDSLNTPRFLALDGDTLVYEQGTWVGYDLARNVAFPISRTASQDDRGKRTMSTPVLISNGRLVWQTQIDETVNLYMADLIKNP